MQNKISWWCGRRERITAVHFSIRNAMCFETGPHEDDSTTLTTTRLNEITRNIVFQNVLYAILDII